MASLPGSRNLGSTSPDGRQQGNTMKGKTSQLNEWERAAMQGLSESPDLGEKTKTHIQMAASRMGKSKTEKKAKSSSENGKKGGRPRKELPPDFIEYAQDVMAKLRYANEFASKIADMKRRAKEAGII